MSFVSVLVRTSHEFNGCFVFAHVLGAARSSDIWHAQLDLSLSHASSNCLLLPPRYTKYNTGSVGYGDICPGDLTIMGRIFLVGYTFGGLGMFCGPCMELASSWKEQVPGGTATLASLVLGIGATIFTMLEGLPQTEAIYASIVTGK